MPRLTTTMGTGFDVADGLASMDDEQLARLLSLRPDLTNPPPRSMRDLASRIAHPLNLLSCVTNLDLGTRQVLEALCLLAQPTSTSHLAALLGGDLTHDDLSRPLDRLAERALVFRDGEQLRLLPVLEQLETPARLGPPLRTVLDHRTVQEISEIAKRIGAERRSPKPKLLDAVAQVLSDPNQLRALLATAPAGVGDLAQRLATQTPYISAPSYYAYYSPRSETPVTWLVATGLVVRTDWDNAVMPREVGLALRGGRPFPDFSAEPPTVPVASIDQATVDEVGASAALGVVAAIAAVLEEWGAWPVKPLKAGGVGIRDLRRAAAAAGRDEREAARLVELAGAAGLLGIDPSTGSIMPTHAYDNWLALPAAQRWTALVNGWLYAGVDLSVAGSAGVGGKPVPPLSPRQSDGHAVRRRSLVLAALTRPQPAGTPDREALQQRVTWDAPAVWERGPAGVDDLVGWVVDEAELFGLTGRGAPTSAGRLVTTGDAEGAATALDPWAPTAVETFVVQADLTAVATGELDGAVRRELELLADAESTGAATVYRFSEASLRRALDAGRSATEVESFLDAHVTHGLPQALRYLITDIGRKHGQIRVGSAASYLRGDDPPLLAEILRARKTAALGLRQLAPTVLVSEADADTVLASLQAAGFLPALESATGEAMVTHRGPQRAPAPAPAKGLLPRQAGPRGDRGPVQQDLPELVKQLRAAAASGADVWAAGVGPGMLPLSGPSVAAGIELDGTDLFADGDRLTEIARGRDDIFALLDLACDEEWWVRLCVTAGNGTTTEMWIDPLQVEGHSVLAERLPDGEPIELRLDQIAWARVATEAEEDNLR